jgi:hypothetical protein
MQIYCTTRSGTLHNQIYGTQNWAFSWMYSRSLRSCRLMGGFINSPLPPVPTPAPRATRPLRSADVTPFHRCRVGGGALARWPPSAAQTVRADFPHTAFTKTHSSGMTKKESIEPSSQARTLRTTWSRAVASSQCCAIGENDAPGFDAQSNR